LLPWSWLREKVRGSVLLGMAHLLLPGCAVLPGLFAHWPGPQPCPQPVRAALIVPENLSAGPGSPKVAVLGVVGVERGSVRTPVAFRYSDDCWLRNGIDKQPLQNALQTTLDLADLSAGADSGRSPDFGLEVQILEQKIQESIHTLGVISRHARLVARYSLKSGRTGELLSSKDIVTEHEVRYGLFVGRNPSPEQASVMAMEIAIKQNLELLVQHLRNPEK
jgi:hypothetical protein